jgi:stearoyl-CoA desaturase (delta-9 desaturase)
VVLFGLLKLVSRDYKADFHGSGRSLRRTEKRQLIIGNWQRAARSKWTFACFHFAVIGAWLFGQVDIVACLVVWFAMQFGVHAGYHRYFTHRSFHTHAWFEAILASVGCLAFQNGPLWWAATHRQHHHFADTESDLHSPNKGFWHAHIGWLWSKEADVIDCNLVPDLYRPIPLWVEKHQGLIHCVYICAIVAIAGGKSLLSLWLIPIVLCWHTTFATNSFCHRFGTQPHLCHPSDFCMARNNIVVGIINLGEGWHNNHHGSPGRCRHGFYRWYQLDIVYIVLVILKKFRIIWGLKQ